MILTAPSRQAAVANQASLTGHSWTWPQAGHIARTICDRIRNSVPISLSMPTSTPFRVFGQTKISLSIGTSHGFTGQATGRTTAGFISGSRLFVRSDEAPGAD
jgi:hypothetical protein